MTSQSQAYQLLLQAVEHDFLAFSEKCFHTLHPGAAFHGAPYQKALAWELERCTKGAGENLLVVNLPPRHLKSEMLSIFYSAWIFGHEPGAQVVSLSYGADLVAKMSNAVRTIMNQEWYKDTFPNTRISSQKNTETDFYTTAGGRRYATTVLSELTGHGGKYILIDDPHNISQLPNAAALNKVANWFRGGVWSRWEGHANGAFIVIMQRYHPQDLTGYLTQEFGFRQLKLEAIAKRESEVSIGPDETWHRKKGDVLNPDWMSVEALEKAKQVMGEPAFEAQYQQDPTFGMGCLYKPEDFPRYKRLLPRHQYEYVIAAFDTASTLEEDSSFTACVICGVVGNEIHVLRVWREKCEFTRLERAANSIIDFYAPSLIIIEDASLGTALSHKLRMHYKSGIHTYHPDKNKLAVALSFIDIVAAKRVHLPMKAPWLKVFEDELFGFPGSPFDDQVDAFNLVLRVIRRRPSALGKIRYQKEPSQKPYPGMKLKMVQPAW